MWNFMIIIIMIMIVWLKQRRMIIMWMNLKTMLRMWLQFMMYILSMMVAKSRSGPIKH